MILAFDVVDAAPDFAQRFFTAALEAGVLLRPIGNTVYFMPPYVLDQALTEQMLAGADAALAVALG